MLPLILGNSLSLEAAHRLRVRGSWRWEFELDVLGVRFCCSLYSESSSYQLRWLEDCYLMSGRFLLFFGVRKHIAPCGFHIRLERACTSCSLLSVIYGSLDWAVPICTQADVWSMGGYKCVGQVIPYSNHINLQRLTMNLLIL